VAVAVDLALLVAVELALLGATSAKTKSPSLNLFSLLYLQTQKN
jgi:hypothetical protein